MIDCEFLILHGVRKSVFCRHKFFSGMTALTVFLVGIKALTAFFFVGIKALTAFCL